MFYTRSQLLIWLSPDVEHTTGPTAGSLAPGIQALPPLRYEGFEPSPYDAEELMDEVAVTVRGHKMPYGSNSSCQVSG